MLPDQNPLPAYNVDPLFELRVESGELRVNFAAA